MTTRLLTNGPTKAYLGDGLYAEIEDNILKLSAEDGIRVTDAVYLERDVWRLLQAYMERHFSKLLGIVALALGLAGPSVAGAVDEYQILATRDGVTYRLPQLVYLDYLDDPATADALAPDFAGDLTLGTPARPFRSVNAQTFIANGVPGLDAVIRLGSCLLTIRGGLIVSAVQDGFIPQPCP